LVVSALGSVAALPAEAQPVTCGQTITADTTLEADLNCGGEPALIIGAPGITLDLGGHRVHGRGAISNEGHDDVTIQNGSVSNDEGGGVSLFGVSGNVVRNVSASGLYDGITLWDSDGNRIVDNRVTSVYLLVINGSDANVIARNTAIGFESGIRISDSAANRVARNISWTVDDPPMRLSSADGNLIRGNTLVSGDAYSAGLLQLAGADSNQILNNTIVTYRRPGTGIELGDSSENLIRGNELTGTTMGVYIRSGDGNELRRNVATGAPPMDLFGAPLDGFRVAAAAQQTLLLRNSASQFEQNGFSLFGGATSAGGNNATDNGGFGIDAVPGTIDLGGNTASGNGATPQCRNITCG